MMAMWGGMDNNPGRPTWGPHLDVNAAIKHEAALALADPLGAAEWDRRAEQRWAYYDRTSPFRAAIDHAFRIKYNYPVPPGDPRVVV